MNNTTNTRRHVMMPHLRTAVGLAGLLVLTACGGDTVVQPTFGTACAEGSLRPGQRVVGAFTAESCTVPYHFYTGYAGPYASYSVSLERGKGYAFHLQQVEAEGADDVDAMLTLWGRNEDGGSIPLAFSDDEAGSGNAEFYFVAPRSGTFSLVASSYDTDDLGGYLLSMAECPVVAVLDTVGTYTDLPFEQSDCIRHNIANSGRIARIVLLAVKADPFDRVDVTVASDDFITRSELGGPAFDIFDYLYDESNFTSAISPAVLRVDMDEIGGQLTLAVGSDDEFTPADTVSFSVTVERTLSPGLRAAALTDGVMTLRRTFSVAKPR